MHSEMNDARLRDLACSEVDSEVDREVDSETPSGAAMVAGLRASAESSANCVQFGLQQMQSGAVTRNLVTSSLFDTPDCAGLFDRNQVEATTAKFAPHRYPTPLAVVNPISTVPKT